MSQEKQIEDLKLIIKNIEREIEGIKDNCKHERYKTGIVESFQFEYVAASLCVVCGHKKDISVLEKMSIYRECFFTEDMTDKQVEKIARAGGFSFNMLYGEK